MRDWIDIVEGVFEPNWSDAHYSGDEIVWVDTQKIMASWSKDRYSYFDSSAHPNAIKGRIERFAEWVKLGEPIRTPELCLTDEGEVSFINGRHRFFWLASQGVAKMPVSVPAQYADAVRDKFKPGD